MRGWAWGGHRARSPRPLPLLPQELPRSTSCNVHGVRAEFLALGRQAARPGHEFTEVRVRVRVRVSRVRDRVGVGVRALALTRTYARV